MSMASQQYVSSSPSYDSSLAWEKNYQQRARTMTRDYINPNSTRLSHRRSRSADSRIQYYRSLQQPSYRDETGPSDYRLGCINMLYPTQDESRATLSYDTGAPMYHSKLPRPSGMYVSESERAGRSLSPPAYRSRKQGSHASRAPSGIVDPYDMASSPGHHNLQNYEYLRNSLIMFGGEDQHSDGTGLSQEELLSRKHRDDAAARRRERRSRNSPSRNRVVNLPPSLQTPHANRQQQQRTLKSVPPPGSFPSTARQMSPYGQSPEPSVYQTSSYGWGNNNSPSYQHQYDPSAPQTPSRPRREHPRGPSSPDPPAKSEWNAETTETAHTPGSKGWRTSMVQRIRSQSSSSGRRWNIIPSLSRSRSVSPGRQPVDPVGPRYSATKFATTPQPENDGDSGFAVIPPKRSPDPPQILKSHSRSSDYSASSQVTYPTENGGHRQYVSSSVGGSLDEDLDVHHMAAQYLRTGREMVRNSSESTQMGRSRSSERSYTSVSKAASQTSTTRQTGGASRHSQSSATGMATPRYKMEPKNYAKINARAWVAQGNNVSAQNSMQNNNTSVSTTPSPAHPRQTSQSMDRFISSSLNNPPGLNMGDFVTSASLAYNASTPQKQKVEGQTKTSPTSVMDMDGINSQWDTNSRSSPCRSTTSTSERPKSILRRRNRGLLMECPSDETPTQAKIVRISDKPVSRGQYISENPSAMGFVDHHGRALSPILNGSFEVDPNAQEITNQPMASQSIPTFEKNIPVQFQQAFIADNGALRADDQSGQISDEYTAFIESVASVVVQTAVRQFLAKLKVKRIRAMTTRKKSSRPPRTQPMRRRHLDYRNKIGALNRPRGPPPVLDIAATQIQSLFRGWYARDCIAVDNYCATIIQKIFRGHLRRRKYLYDRYRVIQVQSLARKRLAYDNFATCMYCVVAIQSAMRGYLVRQRRSQNRVMTQYVHRAATTIQSQWRSFQCEMAFLRAYEHILVVQSVARGWVTRRLIRSWLRAHNIKVSRSLLGLQPLATKSKVAANYRLPQGYNNHTAFMKMKVPQPVDTPSRSTGNTGLAKGLSSSFENRPDSRSRGIRMNKSDTDGTSIPMPTVGKSHAPSWRAKSKWEVNQRPSVEPAPKEPERPVEEPAQEAEDEEVERPSMWRSALRSTGTTPPWQLENVKKDSHSSRFPLQIKESTESKPVIAHAKSCESETGAPSDEGKWRSEVRSNSVGRRVSSSHEFFRNKRSDNEQARLDQIHGTFAGVGLMGSSQAPGNLYGSKLGRSMSDEKKDDTGASYSSPPPSETGGGVKSVARMFGAPASSFGSRGSFDNREAKSLTPAVSTAAEPQKRKSSIHSEMRSMRSESEQRRLDDIMQTFAKVGLLGRTKKN
eukprot:Nitzschia sp. Nitz4//scaffold375_size13900//7797//12027//NITZ4_008967-RA/size13900-snap-gene-0.5-mRNA-1//1//CDS//3329549648//1007//frame0